MRRRHVLVVPAGGIRETNAKAFAPSERGNHPDETKEVPIVVREAKTAKRPTRVAKGASVVEAAQMMLSEDVDELPVVDGEDVVGVVTERDLVSKVMAGELDPARARVADVFSERKSPRPRSF